MKATVTKKEVKERMEKARAARKAKKMAEKAAVVDNVISDFSQMVPETIQEKKKPTTPWRPAKVLDIPEHLKDPRFTYRFVNTKKEGNELKKLQEGWEYDYELAKKLVEYYGGIRTLRDGTPLDSTYRLREMILMRIPKETAQARNQFYADRANRAFRESKRSLQSNIDQLDARSNVYGDIKESEREFIRRE